MGWIPLTDDQFNQLMIFVGLLLPVALSVWARSKVTPVANPKDNSGARLVRADGRDLVR
jgi:hypothetical protein